MCKSVSIAVYSSSVNSVILNPAVEYTSVVCGTSTHTYWFALLSSIVSPLSKFVPFTCLNPFGKYVPAVVLLLDTIVEPPFSSYHGCFGYDVILTPIFDFKSSFVSSIGVFNNFIVTVKDVSSPVFNVVLSNLLITSK